MNVRILGFLILFIVMWGCSAVNEEQLEKQRTQRYQNLILSTAFNCSTWSDMDMYVSKFPEAFNDLKDYIIYPRKVIKDDSLAIEVACHSWVNYGGDFPKNVIYISGLNGFEYAFPFYDEENYSHYISSLKLSRDSCGKVLLEKKAAFQTQLNFVLNHFDSLGLNNKKNVDRFVTLVCDSLLGMKEYSTKDTTLFRKEVEQVLSEWAPYDKVCGQNVKNRINKLVFSAANPNVRYFSPVEGEYAFWKVQVLYVQGRLRLQASMENLECYSVILL